MLAIDACRKSPRSENMLVRLVAFNESPKEVFGFMPLSDIDDAMVSLPKPGGGTALIDAIYACAGAANAYGKQLADQDYLVNAVSFVITDGDDTCSRISADMAKNEVESGAKAEYLEGSLIALIGVNARQHAATLQGLSTKMGLTGFVDAGQADAQSLAKLARFISRSISSVSQSLQSGQSASIGLMVP